jgi:hypothetical protein
MEKQISNHSHQQKSLYINGSFGYVSLRQALLLLDCSKFYIYKLIRKGILVPNYIERDDTQKPTGKPYFLISDIEAAFFKAAN